MAGVLAAWKTEHLQPGMVLPPRRKPLLPRQEGVPHAGASVVLPLPALICLLRIRPLLQEKSREAEVLVRTALEVLPVWGSGEGRVGDRGGEDGACVGTGWDALTSVGRLQVGFSGGLKTAVNCPSLHGEMEFISPRIWLALRLLNQ